ncbi:MAG: MoxR-like ATPase [Hydrogenibacillus schlegelii]|uniref:MoxR-like ATPase n=1 Tax=Hydrogenibacillus schlegelii TaxID=1484 RepID=A0A2T5GC45_HYDSH|nr:MAG: MoxR-like ATPase [Hydrogenibacillus schlegelii]
MRPEAAKAVQEADPVRQDRQAVDGRHPELGAVIDAVSEVVIGKADRVELVLVALLAGGHVLLEDVPGVGKTLLVRAVASALGLPFRRLQFTPDVLPGDVLGTTVPEEGRFRFHPGPIFTHVLMADEINRATPKAQAALLEAMEERRVTVDGETYALPQPFFVLATQNPIEYEGTYPLPEAQLDRFLFRLSLGYPHPEEEERLLLQYGSRAEVPLPEPHLDRERLLQLMAAREEVRVDEAVRRLLLELVARTRRDPRLRLGASPRASIAYFRAVQARAFVRGRTYAVPEDVFALAVPLLAHRVVVEPEAAYDGVRPEAIIRELAGLPSR